jgi:hypothetical protein
MSKWATSVDELVVLFSDAVRALLPIAERAHMAWREPDAYDDWDHICEAIYRSIVIRSIEHADEIGKFMPILDYEWRSSSYEKNSFIGDAKAKEREAFVCFETETSPFDLCLFAVLDSNLNVVGNRRVATADVKFTFVRRDCDRGTPEFFDKLIVSL